MQTRQQAAAEHELKLNRQLEQQLPSKQTRKPNKITSLTPRECEVMRLVATGNQNKQIAKKLGITVRTIKVHRKRGFRKLSVANAVQLAGLVRDGLDVEDPIQWSLENARRLLLAILEGNMRGKLYGRAIRQVGQAIKANEVKERL
jgi:DNA-binding CsgD family transcriptional regulator